MKTVHVLVCLLLLAGTSFADTTWVSLGDVSGNWTAEGNPYIVPWNLTVPFDSSLTIGPGVTVHFMAPVRILVLGQFIAQGTADSLITFTTDTLANPDRWSGIRFNNSALAGLMEHCVLEFGGSTFYALLNNRGSDLAIRNCSIRNVTGSGGAIVVEHGGVMTIQNCIVEDVFYPGSGCGGALSIDDTSRVRVQNSVFRNTTALDGGAICVRYGSSLTVEDCFFERCNGRIWGGAIFTGDNSDLTVTRSVFYGNIARTGGAIQAWGNPTQITQCTFVENTTDIRGDVIESGDDFPPVLNSCIFYGHPTSELFYGSVTVDYGCYWGNFDTGIYGEHGLPEDPLFLNATAGDFRLTEDSPCIDAGDPELPLDSDETRADIGAFFYDQSIAVKDIPVVIPQEIRLFPAYPNPFNAETTIRFELKQQSQVELRIIDLLGRTVETLINESRSAGTHTTNWQPESIASGTYWAELTVGSYFESQQLVYLK